MPGFFNRRSLIATPISAIACVDMRLRGAVRRVRSLFLRDDGISALEFALLAPLAMSFILFIGLIGMQTKNHILMQQIVRAGATAADSDPGVEAVYVRMEEVARAKGYHDLVRAQVNAVPNVRDRLYVAVIRSCYCTDAPAIGQSCETICPDGRPVALSYILRAIHRDSVAINFIYRLVNLFSQGGWGGDTNITTHVVIR